MSKDKTHWARVCGLTERQYYSDTELYHMRLVKLRTEGKEPRIVVKEKGADVEVKLRKCLGCGKEFPSKSVGNRQCEYCLGANKAKGLHLYEEHSIHI